MERLGVSAQVAHQDPLTRLTNFFILQKKTTIGPNVWDSVFMAVYMWPQRYTHGFESPAGYFQKIISVRLCQRFKQSLHLTSSLFILKFFSKHWLWSRSLQGLLEQVSYTPAAMTSFYFLMSLMEGRTVDEAIEEVKTKFVPTYKVMECVHWEMSSNLIFLFRRQCAFGQLYQRWTLHWYQKKIVWYL